MSKFLSTNEDILIEEDNDLPELIEEETQSSSAATATEVSSETAKNKQNDDEETKFQKVHPRRKRKIIKEAVEDMDVVGPSRSTTVSGKRQKFDGVGIYL